MKLRNRLQIRIRTTHNIPPIGPLAFRLLFTALHLQSKRETHSLSRTLIFIILFSSPAIAPAESGGFFSLIKHEQISEIWLNPGFYTYHFQQDIGLNNTNYGLGGEYRYSTTSSFTLGFFDNSDNQTSHYLGWYWQPLGVGPIRVGAVIGAIDGYPKMLEGGWFLAAIPAASFEYRYFGINMLVMPNYKDRLYGAIAFQLKLRVY